MAGERSMTSKQKRSGKSRKSILPRLCIARQTTFAIAAIGCLAVLIGCAQLSRRSLDEDYGAADPTRR
jgi:hypothetical protein